MTAGQIKHHYSLFNSNLCNCTAVPDKDFQLSQDIDTQSLLDVTCYCETIPWNIPVETVSLTLIGLKYFNNASSIFRPLSYLRTVVIKDGRFRILSNNSLEGLNSITKLSFINGELVLIAVNAFQYLQNLISIRFENTTMRLKQIFYPFMSLNKRSFREIVIICEEKNRFSVEILDQTLYRMLEHLHITNLTLSLCRIAVVKGGFSKYLPHLIYLNVSQNHITGNTAAVNEIIFLNNLEVLDASYQLYKTLRRPNRLASNDLPRNFELVTCRLPANLTYFYFHHTLGFFRFPCRAFLPHNNLKFINFLKSSMTSAIFNSLHGLNALEYVNVQSTALITLSKNVYFNLPNLQTLLIGNNKIGKMIEGDKNGTLFSKNPNLISLDIAGNSIKTLPGQFMYSMQHIQSLNLSNNHLKEVDVKHLHKIQLLNISENEISRVTEEFMEHLNELNNVTVELTDNPISKSQECCHIIKFIQWSKHSKVRVHKWQRYQCIMNNRVTEFRSLSIDHLKLECFPPTNSLIISTALILVIIVFLIVGSIVIYTKRWCIRAYIYSGRRYFKLINEQNTGEEYIYKAFVAYHEKDADWVLNTLRHKIEDINGLPLCIHQRDFIPGDPIEENISRGIESSQHVLLIISKAFITSYWCMMELRLARQMALDRGRDTLIPIILEDVDYCKGGHTLINILKEKTYLKWPLESEDGKALFWHRLHETLQRRVPELVE